MIIIIIAVLPPNSILSHISNTFFCASGFQVIKLCDEAQKHNLRLDKESFRSMMSLYTITKDVRNLQVYIFLVYIKFISCHGHVVFFCIFNKVIFGTNP